MWLRARSFLCREMLPLCADTLPLWVSSLEVGGHGVRRPPYASRKPRVSWLFTQRYEPGTGCSLSLSFSFCKTGLMMPS